MKEHPILFSGAMVRAILDGRKTQTRRVVKPQPPDWYKPVKDDAGNHMGWLCSAADLVNQGTYVPLPGDFPYGVEGDRLWVRETWAHETDFGTATGGFMYRATYTNGGPADNVDKWRPSIFMPRQASRITLELTGVRVERVQDISDADAIAEGIREYYHMPPGGPKWFGVEDSCVHPLSHSKPEQSFRLLWDSINAERGYGWSVNPWVWVLSFRRIEQ